MTTRQQFWIALTSFIILVAACISTSSASEYTIERRAFGSGHSAPPGFKGSNQVYDVTTHNDGIYFTPQYLPGFPTAATIWPRVVDVKCKKIGIDTVCDGYQWRPEYGRGEYLMFRPVIQKQQPLAKPRIVYVEVPPKKKKQ